MFYKREVFLSHLEETLPMTCVIGIALGTYQNFSLHITIYWFNLCVKLFIVKGWQNGHNVVVLSHGDLVNHLKIYLLTYLN